MTKVAIVSSYDEECGAAFFSSRLKIHLEKSGLQVDVLRLPVSLLRVNNPRNVRMKGHAEVSRIAARLKALESAGVIERTPYHEGPVRYSYRLTESGDALIGVLDAILEWGKQYAVAPDDPDRQRRYRPLSELKAKESR